MIDPVKVYLDQIKGLRRELSDQEERELIDRSRYDKNSKELLFNQYLDLVVSLARGFSSNFSLLELISEGNSGLYNLVYKRLDLFKQDCSFKNYATGTIINSILDFLRKERKKPKLSLEVLSESILGHMGSFNIEDKKTETPSKIVEREEILDRFYSFLETIEERDRLNLIMYFYGYSTKKIREAVDLKETSQWRSRKEVLKKLKQKF